MSSEHHTIINPDGEHPVPDLIVPDFFLFCNPSQAPFRDHFCQAVPVLVKGPVDERFSKHRDDSFECRLK
ncbi:hypothetical protein [Methanospirillum sp.]|uniref:hypothetical protein n=1 Tax=Methanospirillum sp. TaxID=45200 RepID=UPI002CF2DEDA|nr:hypothetical protein [Methanospirillum sp.]HPP79149.1 hypothetical protein [Methanospirillum sp.]